jgi:hypothetical protein
MKTNTTNPIKDFVKNPIKTKKKKKRKKQKIDHDNGNVFLCARACVFSGTNTSVQQQPQTGYG